MQSLKVFLAVVADKSFSAAAERLELSRAVVSKHVKYLEEQVGTRLLERTTRSVALTESGRAFYERAQRAVGELEEAMLEAGQATVAPRGKLRMTCSVSFGVLHLSSAISAFLDRYPSISIHLDLSDRFVDLSEEGFDLAIRIAAVPQNSLIARKLAAAHLVVCGSPDYLAQYGTPRLGEDLKAGRLMQVLGEYDAGELGIYAVYTNRKFLPAKVRTLLDFLIDRFHGVAPWEQASSAVASKRTQTTSPTTRSRQSAGGRQEKLTAKSP